MHVITRKRLNDFAQKHPDALSALAHWYRLMKRGHFRSFIHLRETFPSADLVGKLTVFNIGGNKYRLSVTMRRMSLACRPGGATPSPRSPGRACATSWSTASWTWPTCCGA